MKTFVIPDHLKSFLSLIVHLVENSLFLKKCLICSIPLSSYQERYICKKCKEEIEKNEFPVCEICNIQISNGNYICGQCSLSHPPYDKHLSYNIYKDKMRKLILLYKLSGIEPLKNYISDLYMNSIDEGIRKEYDIIIPVPSDPGRKKVFEPVTEIAYVISRLSGVEISIGNLIKKKTTGKQSSLNYNQRLKNLNGAFMIIHPEKIKGKRVLLIDDVYTTGTTIKKCSIVLKKFASSVYAVTLARSSNIHLD